MLSSTFHAEHDIIAETTSIKFCATRTALIATTELGFKRILHPDILVMKYDK